MTNNNPEFKMPEVEELDPKKSPISYHYCSLETFLAIIGNRSIRLSDINTMNDYSEMHWAYARFIEAVNLVYNEYEKDFFDYLDQHISQAQLHTLTLLACFSTDGDVLSQWRAYADNGAGVAIGFDSAKLPNLSVRCGMVTYDPAIQVQYFRDLFAATFPLWKNDKSKKARKLLDEFLVLKAFDMCLMKSPAFAEEKEVRVARAIVVDYDKDGWHLSDAGGSGKDKISAQKQPIKYRSKGAGIVAHIDLPIAGIGSDFIKRIVIGPRSENNGNEVSMVLNANGFRGCDITHSLATYR